jgi:hypothetical protein
MVCLRIGGIKQEPFSAAGNLARRSKNQSQYSVPLLLLLGREDELRTTSGQVSRQQLACSGFSLLLEHCSTISLRSLLLAFYFFSHTKGINI